MSVCVCVCCECERVALSRLSRALERGRVAEGGCGFAGVSLLICRHATTLFNIVATAAASDSPHKKRPEYPICNLRCSSFTVLGNFSFFLSGKFSLDHRFSLIDCLSALEQHSRSALFAVSATTGHPGLSHVKMCEAFPLFCSVFMF